MNNFLEKFYIFLDYIADINGLSDKDKIIYFENINSGLTLNLLADGKNVVSEKTFEHLKMVVNNQNNDQNLVRKTIEDYVLEMIQQEEGKKILKDTFTNLLDVVYKSSKDKLSQNQKEELLGILV